MDTRGRLAVADFDRMAVMEDGSYGHPVWQLCGSYGCGSYGHPVRLAVMAIMDTQWQLWTMAIMDTHKASRGSASGVDNFGEP